MNILVIGDSFSHYCGFDDPTGKLWLSPLIDNHTVTNLSWGGQSNYKIFIKATSELIRNHANYDLVIIQWSSLFRLSFNDNSKDYGNYGNLVICNLSWTSDDELKSFHKLWSRRFTHSIVEIEEFLLMVLMLDTLLKQYNKPYIFIKGFENFINELQHDNWQSCSEQYRKFVLNMDSQPDSELHKIHSKLKNLCDQLKKQSGTNWVNLDGISWFDQIGDRADDGGHPGIETNKLYYQQVINLATSIGINL